MIVNRDNLGDLAKAIGMFSPEDVNLIMRAITLDAKIQQMQYQIDEETSGKALAEDIEDAREQSGVEEFMLQALLADTEQNLQKEEIR